jgi:hypothetical protein
MFDSQLLRENCGLLLLGTENVAHDDSSSSVTLFDDMAVNPKGHRRVRVTKSFGNSPHIRPFTDELGCSEVS